MDELHFDDVIVGGGSAGCALANRLSADGRRRVLLIEAGMDTPPEATPPEILDSYPMPLFFGDKYIWPGLSAAAGRDAEGKPVVRAYEQARVMGGGSSINVQSANRGLPRDYDEWHALGARGWGWTDVLPYFLKLETDLDFDGPLHGRSGPIPIRRIAREAMPRFGKAVGEALSATGLPSRNDQNAEFDDGIFPPAFSNRDDRRVSTAAGYLDAASRARSNLTLWAESEVEQIQLEGRRATGVVLARGGQKLSVRAGRVILTAGALQSPAMLMRAGIGPPAALQSLGIPVIIDLPGVGSNLRDHPALTFCQYLPRRLRLPLTRRRPNFVAMRFSSGQQGCCPSDMYITASARGGWHALGTRLGLYFLWCNRPYSSGSLTLASRDPKTYPVVDFNLLSDARDLERMVASVRLLAKLVVHPALNPAAGDFFPASYSPRIKRLSRHSTSNRIIASVLGPILDVPAGLRQLLIRLVLLNGSAFRATLTDDRALEAFVRQNVFGVWHPVGTCRMGDPADPMAVVDPEGRVIGSDNIFVADASIIPRLPTANTNIPVIMAAEKISDALLRRC
ncbi:GMC family oxidoreductase [Bradyrhizobium guangdongense]|uniref:Glucose dehydrogenase n=1 Tax=Bradyrhizobium guangdongense TaxID=1325090 RepID=A0A410V5W2_9BRAD|nr:GMC oxidoreductase [Bradyrhizobium guangdongense]QAU39042.1 glucose-methanol-choline oxidoreductase [Bradyrhizobium guangdongense]QOZ60097.1 glucose-methanol-choline oxidoreductase [Bradyrhizobium guangdongense]GGI23620.1 glucose dehydrogenase [Bradyrhizobium guangdongense]